MSDVYTPVRIAPDSNGVSNGGSTDLLSKTPSDGAPDFYTEVCGRASPCTLRMLITYSFI